VRDDRPVRAFLRRRALSALILLIRMRRIAIVRTIHNLRPHEAGHAAEDRVLDTLDRRTNLFIRLNPTTPAPDGFPTVTSFGDDGPLRPILEDPLESLSDERVVVGDQNSHLGHVSEPPSMPTLGN